MRRAQLRRRRDSRIHTDQGLSDGLVSALVEDGSLPRLDKAIVGLRQVLGAGTEPGRGGCSDGFGVRVDLSKVDPLRGRIILGPEQFEESNEAWKSTVEEI